MLFSIYRTREGSVMAPGEVRCWSRIPLLKVIGWFLQGDDLVLGLLLASML